jgi:membrane-associated phospholipid phosphatase
MKNPIEYIGDYSPEFIQLISIYAIFVSGVNTAFIIAYIIGIIINDQINKLLKQLTYKNMPSGHFQAILYSIIFTYLALRKTKLFKQYWIYFAILYFIITAFCFYNCIKYKYHSLLEMLIGSIVGVIIACIEFYLIFSYSIA